MTNIRQWERNRPAVKNWKELLINGLKSNLSLLDEDYVIVKNIQTNERITASEMIKLIESDDESVNDFYEDVLSTTIRIMQLRCKKEINLEND